MLFFILTIAGILSSLILLELMFNLFMPQKTFKNLYTDIKQCWINDEQVPFTLEANCQMEMKSNEFTAFTTINSLGYRGSMVELPKPKDVKRIIITGDSFIFGWGVEDTNTVSKRLEDLVSKEQIFEKNKVEVINAGFMGGLSPDGHLINLRKMLERGYNPDIVIMSVFVYNDISDMAKNEWVGTWDYSIPNKVRSRDLFVTEDNQLIHRKLKSFYKNPIFMNSNIVAILSRNQGLIEILNKVKSPTESESSYNVQDDCIFDETCEERTLVFSKLNSVMESAQQLTKGKPGSDVELLVLIIPADFQIYQDAVKKYGGENASLGIRQAYKIEFPQPQKAIKKFLDQEGIEYLDLLSAFRQNSYPRKFFIEDGHWNEFGHQLTAEEIVKWIEKTKN